MTYKHQYNNLLTACWRLVFPSWLCESFQDFLLLDQLNDGNGPLLTCPLPVSSACPAFSRVLVPSNVAFVVKTSR